MLTQKFKAMKKRFLILTILIGLFVLNIHAQCGGTVLGCGTCLQSRKNNEPQVCRFSSMSDLYELIRKNKIVLTF